MKHAFTLLVAIAPVMAAAQPGGGAGAQAEVLFNDGKQLMTQKQYAAACTKFAASQELEPTVTTLVNEADCREKNHQLATAFGLFLDVERQTRGATDVANKKLHEVAEGRAAKLEPRLSKLTITVAEASKVQGLEVVRDDQVVPSGTWNTKLPIDGGKHKITARAQGFEPWVTEVTVGDEGDTKAIEVPKLEPAHVEVTPPKPTPSPTPPSAAPSHTGAILFGVGALVLGGGGIGAEIWARRTYDRSKKESDNAKQDSLWHDANTRRYIGLGLDGAAIVCAGVSIYLLVRSGSEHKTAVAPTASSDGAGVTLVGVW